MRIPFARRFLLILVFGTLLVPGCHKASSTCESCHKGLEPASDNHRDCVACHGGDPEAKEEKASHRTMYGPKNPAGPESWDKTCGRCHPYQLSRVKANLMHTNTGMIKNIQLTWEGVDGQLYATRQEELFDAEGNPLQLKDVRQLDNLAGELYRKFCSLCHVGIQNDLAYGAVHSSGCAACHFPYNDSGTYEGQDETVRGKWPYSETHTLSPLPDNRVCVRCHNRSGRIALSYQGYNDGNNSMVPTRNGFPGPLLTSGARNMTSIPADIHFEKGMDCIDCHTSRDIMGDGYAYENLYYQIEIGCEDCHGSAAAAPKSETIARENEEAVRESKSYPLKMRPGMDMVLTSKGRKYSNVFVRDGKVWVLGKRSGKLHESKVITGTPEHTIAGHERLECHACHSRTVTQCYGCHTKYDQTRYGTDFIKEKETPGAFSETEDYRMLYPFPLALNQRGKISAVTPGCQTFVTVVDKNGRKVKDEYVATFKGKPQLRFAPFFSHNTGPRAVGCSECHGNPAFLGFGQHVVEKGDIRATLLCDRCPDKPLDGFITMEEGKVRAFAAITRENSRPFNGTEVKKILAVNLCLVCHNDPKDKIYQEKLDYRELDTCLTRRVSADR